MVSEMPGDRVDHASHGVTSVEQGGRTFEHLDPFQIRRIDGLAVIARLGGQGTDSNPILHDQNPVSFKATQDGTGTSGTEAAFGHPRLAVQDLAD